MDVVTSEAPARTILQRQPLTTLRERLDPAHTALLVIDMQNDYLSEGGTSHRHHGSVSEVRKAVPTTAALLEAAREASVLVIYVQMTLDEDLRYASDVVYLRRQRRFGDPRMVIKGTWGHEVVPELSPRPGDLTIEKQRSSAFESTNLDLVLRSSKILSVIVTGVVTNGCVLATTIGAIMKDYYVTVASDCVASRKRDVHDAALLVIEGYLEQTDGVLPSTRIMDEWHV